MPHTVPRPGGNYRFASAMCEYVDNGPPLGRVAELEIESRIWYHELWTSVNSRCYWPSTPATTTTGRLKGKNLAFIHSLTKHLMSTYCVPGIVPLADTNRDLRRWIYQEAKGQRIKVLTECGNVCGGGRGSSTVNTHPTYHQNTPESSVIFFFLHASV